MGNPAHNAAQCSSGKVVTPFLPVAPGCSRPLLVSLVLSALVAGCGTTPAPKPEEPVAAKPAEPAVPDEVRSAADSLLGSESQVLAFGDLAKTGKQQILVANVGPKTPQNSITGTIVKRAVIGENDSGQTRGDFR